MEVVIYNMRTKSSVSFVLGAGLVSACLCGLFPAGSTYAEGCVAADGLAVEGVINSAGELEHAIENKLAEAKLGEDFVVSCNPSYFEDDFVLDLNGHTLTSQVAWALDIETSDKTLTIMDSVGGGKYTANDAGIWAENGANVVVDSGVVEVTAGRGRAVQVTGGKLAVRGGEIRAANGSYESGGQIYYHNTALVHGEGASAEVTGGKIVSDNGKALYVYDEGVAVLMSDGEVSSTGDYALMVSDGATLTMSGGKIEAKAFPLTTFNGSTVNVSAGEVHSETGFAISSNFNESPAYVNISGGEFISDKDFVILFPGDPASVSRLSISGEPTLTGAGGVIAMNSGILEIAGGTFTSLGTEAHSGSLGNGSNGFTNSVLGLATAYADVTGVISGGTFINDGDSELIWTSDVCKELGTSGTCNLSLEIAGGEFSSEPEHEYIAKDKELYDLSAEGPWVVDEQTEVDFPETIYLTVGESYVLAPTEVAAKYLSVGGATEVVDFDAEEWTFTATATGTGTFNYKLHNYLAEKVDRNIEIVVVAPEDVEVLAAESDDTEINGEVVAFVTEQLKTLLESGEYENESVWLNLDALKEAIGNNETISLVIERQPIVLDENIDAAEELIALIDEKNYPVAAVYSAQMLMYDERGNDFGMVSELGTSVKMSLDVPEESRTPAAGYERKFYVLRGHKALDGTATAEVIEAEFDGEKVIFENDKFSNFVVTYVDELATETPNTGAFTKNDGGVKQNTVQLWAVVLAWLMAVVGLRLIGFGARQYVRNKNLK